MIVSDMQSRDMMLELDPETYFITDHYKDYPSVLVRLSKINASELKTMLQRRWQQIAPKKLVKEAEGAIDKTAIPGERRKAARGKGPWVAKTPKEAKKKTRRK
jgi:hypothetical protein